MILLARVQQQPVYKKDKKLKQINQALSLSVMEINQTLSLSVMEVNRQKG
jgi:hypothetical protein